MSLLLERASEYEQNKARKLTGYEHVDDSYFVHAAVQHADPVVCKKYEQH